MKRMIKPLLFTVSLAAILIGAGNALAQGEAGGGGNAGGGNGGRRGGTFDPAQFQQRILDRVKERLAFTNDTEWAAVQPLVQKVMDARREVGIAGMGMMGRGGRRGGGAGGGGAGGETAAAPADQGNRRPAFFQPGPEAEALQKTIDNNAPAAQIKDALAKYRVAHKDKEAKLAAAQADLLKVLSTRQEAEAVLLGLLN